MSEKEFLKLVNVLINYGRLSFMDATTIVALMNVTDCNLMDAIYSVNEMMELAEEDLDE